MRVGYTGGDGPHATVERRRDRPHMTIHRAGMNLEELRVKNG